jgi:hypothetical protein
MPPNQSKGKERDDEKEDTGWFDNALRPTREWYMLLAGLLTRAVLEGYLTAGWRGTKPVECLLLVGMGIKDRKVSRDTSRRKQGEIRGVDQEKTGEKGNVDGSDDDDGDDDFSEAFGDEEEFAEFDPDGFLSLPQAIRVLFPSLKAGPDVTSTSAVGGGKPRKGQAEMEYKMEMYDRLRRVSTLGIQARALLTHIISFTTFLNQHQTCQPTWKTWRGLILQSPLSVLLSDSVKLWPNGEESPSLRRYATI